MFLAAGLLGSASARAECVKNCPVHGIQPMTHECPQVGGWITPPGVNCGDDAPPAVGTETQSDAEREAAARAGEVRARKAVAEGRATVVRAEKMREQTEESRAAEKARKDAAARSQDGLDGVRKSMEAESSAYGQALNANETHKNAKAFPLAPYDSAGKPRGAVKITGSAATLPIGNAKEIPPGNRARAAELTKEREAVDAKIAETRKTLAGTTDPVKQVELREEISHLTSQKGTIQIRIDDLSVPPRPARTPKTPPLVPPAPEPSR